jgi:hypothetical protein
MEYTHSSREKKGRNLPSKDSSKRPKKKIKVTNYNYQLAAGSTALVTLSNDLGNHTSSKRKPDTQLIKPACQKHLRHELSQNEIDIVPPHGLIWNASTWSCAYDALFTILHLMWNENKNVQYTMSANSNLYWKTLHTGFLAMKERLTMEAARDQTRLALNHAYEATFSVTGTTGTSLTELCHYMFEREFPVNKKNCEVY